MKSTPSLLTGILVLLLASGSEAFAQDQAALYQRAQFVFDGTIVRNHGSSSREIAASSNTIVVRADSVLKKPPSVLLRDGAELTIAVKERSSYEPGQRARFFADGIVFGTGIEVKEITHTKLAQGTFAQSATASGEHLREQAETEQLRDKVKTAAAVVVGRVVEVLPAPLRNSSGSGHISEHDANWQNAVVEVQGIVKGSPGKQIVVHFPASIDVAWVNDPKLKVGQEATLILDRDHVSGLPNHLMMAGTVVTTYTALRPGDVLPASEAQRLREFAKQ